MKKAIFIVLLFASTASIAQTRAEATFETKSQTFRDVKIGTQLRVVYYFQNTGGSPLLLQGVKPTCGCTVAEYPKYPIEAGAKDSIVATFDTNKRLGYNAKGINIESNEGPISLVFEAYVIDLNGTEPSEYPDEKEEDHTGHTH
jgi:hypothetical protein